MKLVLDTSSLNVSLGIKDKEKWVYCVDHEETKHQQSKLILKLVLAALEQSNLKPHNIEAVAVGVGPGSYTGLRVGMTVAKIWSFSMNIPLYCFSSEVLLKRTQEQEKNSEFPKVKHLKETDLQLVEKIDELQPVYENDHFA